MRERSEGREERLTYRIKQEVLNDRNRCGTGMRMVVTPSDRNVEDGYKWVQLEKNILVLYGVL